MSPGKEVPVKSVLLAATLALAAALPASAQDRGATARPPRAAAPKDWRKHTGNIPFIIGREQGMKEVEFTGKPILFFYTATW